MQLAAQRRSGQILDISEHPGTPAPPHLPPPALRVAALVGSGDAVEDRPQPPRAQPERGMPGGSEFLWPPPRNSMLTVATDCEVDATRGHEAHGVTNKRTSQGSDRVTNEPTRDGETRSVVP